MESAQEQKRMQVRELAPSRWFKNPMESTFVMRVYSCLGIPFENINESFQKATQGIRFDDKIFFGLFVFGGLKYPGGKPFICFDETGILKIIMDFQKVELPNSSYAVVLTPKKVDGVEPIPHEVKTRLDTFAGVFRAHTGLNFMRDLVFEGEFWAGEEKFTTLSEALRLPKPTEGPHFNHDNWIQSKSIFDALKGQPIEVRKRLELAIEFFNRALDDDDSFFNYWTAFEIACNGSAQAIRHKIKTALDLPSLEEVDQCGFREIARWRHQFFHKGLRPTLTAETDRFLQLLFIDILRQELGIAPIKHTLAMIRNGGYDLSPLGVQGRMNPERTSEENTTPNKD